MASFAAVIVLQQQNNVATANLQEQHDIVSTRLERRNKATTTRLEEVERALDAIVKTQGQNVNFLVMKVNEHAGILQELRQKEFNGERIKSDIM